MQKRWVVADPRRVVREHPSRNVYSRALANYRSPRTAPDCPAAFRMGLGVIARISGGARVAPAKKPRPRSTATSELRRA